jgi:hypothetical protein
MPKGMQAIYSQVVGVNGVGNAAAIFYNIPQTYTDLKIVVSQRNTSSNVAENLAVRFDDANALYSHTTLYGSGAGVATSRSSNSAFISYTAGMFINGNNSTANTYGTFELYIPNYTSNLFKQCLIDAVTENNATEAYASFTSVLYRNQAPIRTVYVQGYSAGMANGTTITIYGISR